MTWVLGGLAVAGWVLAGLGYAAWHTVRERARERGEWARYWQDRAEKLIDAGLARTGAIHQPTMEDRAAPQTGREAWGSILAAMNMTEKPRRDA